MQMIVWEDHIGSAEWTTKEQIKKSKPAVVTTIGWIAHEDRKKVHLVSSIVDDGDIGGESLILKKTIIKRYDIEMS